MRNSFYYSILIFIFSIIIGFYYSIKWKNNVSVEKQKNEIVQEASFQEEKLSYDSDFCIKKYYSKCGHSIISNAEIPNEFINLTREDVEENYPEWDIEEFNNGKIVLAKIIDEFCEEHYVVKMSDETINIYHQKQPNDIEFYKTTNISTDYLEDEDKRKLEEGIYVYGKEKLNSTIEDFE